MTGKKKEQIKADLLLISMTLCWGLSYHSIDLCIGETGTAGLTAIRFIIAFAIVAVIFRDRLKEINRDIIFHGFLIGFFLAICYQAATLSVKYTLTTNAAFLCTLSLLMVPLIEFALFRKRPPSKIVITIAIALVGIVLLTMGTGFSFGNEHAFGDICGLLSSFFYAFEMIFTERAVRKHKLDPVLLGVVSIGWTGLVMLAMSIPMHDIGLPHSGNAIMALIFLSVFCSAYPFIVQPIAQRHTETSHVGIIITLEPVFASLYAFLFEGIVPSGMQLLGQILMFSSMLLLEIDLPFFKKEDS